MAETKQSQPQAQISTVAGVGPGEWLLNSFSIWPPTERSREAFRNRLIEALLSSSILSMGCGTLSREEAVEDVKVIEDEAFEMAAKAAVTDDAAIENLQVYCKEIGKGVLEKVKSRSGEPASAAETAAAVDVPNKPE